MENPNTADGYEVARKKTNKKQLNSRAALGHARVDYNVEKGQPPLPGIAS